MADDEVGVKLSVKDRARFSSEVNTAKKDVESFGTTAEAASRRAGGTTTGFNLFRSALGGIATVAKTAVEGVAIVGGAAVALGAKLFKMGEDAQAVRLRFTDTFGAITPQMDAFIKTVNQKYGLPTVDLERATAQFGRLGQAAKLPTDQLVPFSKNTVQAGLDLAAFYNKDPTAVFTALSSGLSGLTRPLRQYGIFIEQANIDAKAMQMGLGNNALASHKATEANQALNIAIAKQHAAMTKYGASSVEAAAGTVAVERAQDAVTKAAAGSSVKLTDAQKVMIRQQLIQEQMGAAAGALARRVDTAGGQWRIFQGRLKDTAYTVGTSLLPLGTSLLRMLNDQGKPILAWLATNAPIWANRLSGALSFLSGVLQRAFAALHERGFQGFAESLDNSFRAGGRLTAILTRVGGDVSDLVRIFRTGVLPAALTIIGVVVFLAGKLTALDSVIHYLADRGWLVRDAILAITGVMVANAVISGILIVKDGIHTVLLVAKAAAQGGYSAALATSTALEEANAVAGGITQAVLTSGIVRLGVSVVGWLAHAAAVAIDTAGRYAWLAINVVGGLLAEGVQLGIIVVKWIALSAVMTAQAIARGVATAATWLWVAAQWALNIAMDANPIGLLIVAVVLLVAGIVLLWTHSKTFRAIVSEAFGFVWNVIMDMFHWTERNWPLLLAIFLGPFGPAVFVIIKNWSTIKGAAMDAFHWIEHNWPLLLAILTGPVGIALYAFIHFFDSIRDGFKAVINWVIRAWNSLHFHVAGVDVGPVHVKGFDLGVPHVPELHEGGMLTTAGVVNMKPEEELVYLPAAAAVVPLPKDVPHTPPSAGPTAPSGPKVVQLVVDRRVLAEVALDGTADLVARK